MPLEDDTTTLLAFAWQSSRKQTPPQKMHVDFSGWSSIAVPMDEIDRELINLLCTKIGMLMEDHSARALSVGSLPADQQISEVAALSETSAKIAKLTAAAQSIAE